MKNPPIHQKMPEERQYSDLDARSLVRLLGEVCALPDEHVVRKAYLMDGLCDLLGADGWAAQIHDRVEGSMSGEQSFRQLSFLNTHLDHLANELLSAETVPRQEGTALSRLHAVGPLIFSMWSTGGEGVSTVIIHRSCGSPLFTPREAGLAEIVLSEVRWLHDADWTDDQKIREPDLSPRESIVLHLLLKGENRKAIADRLGISINTVSSYAREIYRKVGVCSQAELLRSFVSGGKPAPASAEE